MKRLIALLLAFPLVAGATTYHASESGSGLANGTSADNAWARTGINWTTVQGGGNTLCVHGEITGNLNTGGTAGGGSVIDLGCEDPATINVSGSNGITIDVGGWTVEGAGGEIANGTVGVAVAADDVTLNDITCTAMDVPCVRIDQSASRDNITINRLTATTRPSYCVYLNATTASTTFSNITITDPTCRYASQYGIWMVVSVSNTTSSLSGIQITGGAVTDAATTNIFVGHQEPNVFNNEDFYAADIDVSRARGGGGMVVKGFTSSTAAFSADNAIRRITAHDIVGNNGGLNVFYSKYMEIEAMDCKNIVPESLDGACVFLDHGNEDIRSFGHYARDLPGLAGVDNSGMCFVSTTASANIEHYSSICHNAKSCYHHGNHPTYTTDSTAVTVANLTCTGIELYGLFISQGIDGAGEFTANNNTLSGDGTSGGIGIYQTSVGSQTVDYNNVTGFETAYSGLSAGGNDQAEDPQLEGGDSPSTAAGFMPTTSSPLLGAGTAWWSGGAPDDYSGRAFHDPPAIGAYASPWYFMSLDGTAYGRADCSSPGNACSYFGDPDLTAVAGDTICLIHSRGVAQDAGIGFTNHDGTDDDNRVFVDGDCDEDGVYASITTPANKTPLSLNDVNWVTFKRLRFNRSGNTDSGCIVVTNNGNSDGVTFDDVIAEDCGFGYLDGGWGVNDLVITNSTFRGNASNSSIYINLPGTAVNNITITNNTFENTESKAVTIQPDSGNELTADVNNVLIDGNTVTNTYGGITVHLGDTSDKSHPCIDSGPRADNVQITNNTIVDAYNQDNLSAGYGSVGGSCWEDGRISGNHIERISTYGSIIQHSAGINTIIEDNTVIGPAYPANDADGGGIFIDQRTVDVIARRNFIYNVPYPPNLADGKNSCTGYGICLYRSTRALVYGNVVIGAYGGVRVNGFDNGGVGTETNNSVLAGNFFADIETDAIFLRSNIDRADSVAIYNNFGVDIGDAFLELDSGGTEQASVDGNGFYQAARGYVNQTPGANSLFSIDPRIVGRSTILKPDDVRPLPDSPLLESGVCYLSTGCAYPDYEGRRTEIPPHVGAYARSEP